MNDGVGRVFQSPQQAAVRRRIFRQLVESLVYEGIVEPQVRALQDGLLEFSLSGRDAHNQEVRYACQGRRALGFDRVRLTALPVQRDGEEATSLSTFLLEVSHLLKADSQKLAAFIEELHQTLLKDTFAQDVRFQQPPLRELSYDELEGEVMDGHPYHPCYKSRVGFDLVDNQAFGPEFKPRLRLVWLAVRQEEARTAVVPGLELDAFVRQELGAATHARFADAVALRGRTLGEYTLIPVHPWQWREIVSGGFVDQLGAGRLIYLGEGEDEYRPQQSIRTLANATRPEKAYVKLPLSIANTSTSRILSQHTILNAPAISGWLGGIQAQDSFLREELGLTLLREIVGVTYNHQGLSGMLEPRVYGTLGTIWRESLHPHLRSGEAAVPFNALCHVATDGRPLIDGWIREQGTEAWTRELLEVAILPLIRLLYSHGVAMEAHAQNMVLIHRAGRPARLALKDFHDGIRFARPFLRTGDAGPKTQGPPANHPRVNRNSFLERDDPSEVKDFFHDAFFFINLGELSLFLLERYGLPEERFWAMAAEVIHGYQRRFPHEAERFTAFDLFSERIAIEQLTGRRLFAEAGTGVHMVRNPLAAFRTGAR
ncbi:IucA/IucC family protein [Archangium lansingense]|uniref:IucA/IucC family protein n=1 Tax=Archangium lansingense TaxID=2995310 RepID=UPI003B775013